MDFRLSYEWLKEFIDVRLPPEEFADCLSLHSVSVERIRRMDEGLGSTVVVGRVEKLEPHPNADKLRIVHVVTTERRGGATSPPGRPRRAAPTSDTVQVVCGGTNLREGMLVAFAPPGAMVRWHGQGEPVELKPTDIRGVRSDGMICAASEIGLGEYFSETEREILDLSFLELERRGGVTSPPDGRPHRAAPTSHLGQPLARVLGLDDAILDCEITTNRPDLMSVVGLAREVAAITRTSFRPRPRRVEESPIDRTEISRLHSGSARDDAKRVNVRIDDRKGCPRYGAAVIDGVKVGPSPWWMQRRLLAAGLHPINNVVDATNYVMLESGQPLHAFDAAKLTRTVCHPEPSEGSRPSREREIATRPSFARNDIEIAVRRATVGESIVTLDGVTRALTPDVLVIAADSPAGASGGGVVALAGVMGGQETGVTEATTRVVLECANFDPMVIRRGARRLNVRTDASTRFEKGLQPEAIAAVLPRAVELLCALTGGTAGSAVVAGATSKPMRPIAFQPTRASERIGVPSAAPAMRRSLTALGCTVKKKTSGFFSVTPPWWRRGDLEGVHDLVEEVARVYGYHRLPSTLPSGTLPAGVRAPEPPHTPFDWEDRGRDILTGAGVTEVMAYSLVSREAIERSGYTVDQCVALENPLSEELAFLRPSFIPTLLPIIAANQGHTPKGLLFEMGKVYIPKLPATSSQLQADRSAGLPREEMRVLIAAYGRMVSGGHVMQVKGIVEHLFNQLGIRDATFRISEQCELPSGVCVWHPGRTMDVVVGGTLVGVLGEIHPTVVEQFGVDQRVAAAELDWAPILAACRSVVAAAPPAIFPAVKRDLAFVVDRRTPHADIAAVLERFDPLLNVFDLFDQYEGGNLPVGKKSLAFHLVFEHSDRTLNAAEVDALLARLSVALRQRFGAEVRE